MKPPGSSGSPSLLPATKLLSFPPLKRVAQDCCRSEVAWSTASGNGAIAPLTFVTGDWILTVPGVLKVDDAVTLLSDDARKTSATIVTLPPGPRNALALI